MWLHIVIFVILFLLAAGSRLGWLHVEQIGTQKGRKLFLAVALTGNIMGLAMTCTKGGGEIYQDGYELKKEEDPYEEKFMVSMEGEETGSVYIQIPEKELEKKDAGEPEELTTDEKREQQLLEYAESYNIIIIFQTAGMANSWNGKHPMTTLVTFWRLWPLQRLWR